MVTTMARHRPILTGPRHRRDWRTWWRRCTCGLRWRCPDAGRVPPPAEPAPVRRAVGVANADALRGPTMAAPLVGRPVWFTLAGEYRANGGRWDGIDRTRAAAGGRRR